MNKYSKAYIFSLLSLVFIALIGCIIFFWLNWPYNPAYFRTKTNKVITKTVKAGDVVAFETDYCKNINIPVKVSSSFINGIIFSTPETITNLPVGCNVKTVYKSVPKELPSGKYYIRTYYRYEVNPIRTITIQQNTDTFEVINDQDNEK